MGKEREDMPSFANNDDAQLKWRYWGEYFKAPDAEDGCIILLIQKGIGHATETMTI